MGATTLPKTALAAFFTDQARDAACAVLRAAGVMNVLPATTSPEPDEAHAASADVIVTDWPPAGLDLETMLRDLRAKFGHGGAQTPVVMLSHRAGRADVDAARRAGVDAYVVCPVSSALLKHRLARLAPHGSPLG